MITQMKSTNSTHLLFDVSQYCPQNEHVTVQNKHMHVIGINFTMAEMLSAILGWKPNLLEISSQLEPLLNINYGIAYFYLSIT